MVYLNSSLAPITCIISTLTFILCLVLYMNSSDIRLSGLNIIGYQKYQSVERKQYEYINPLIRSETSFQTVSKSICNSDKEKVELIKSVSFENLGPEYDENLRSLFYDVISNPLGGICSSLKRFGGAYRKDCHYWDGHKFVCVPELIKDIRNDECLVYTFGVSNDWSFEAEIGEMGCKVFSFDPTVDHPKQLEDNVWFEKLGLGIEKDSSRSLDSLSSILHNHGHTNTKISYLKIDIEGGEIEGLKHWFESGALDNVQQIGMEYHLNQKNNPTNYTLKLFSAIQQIYLESDFRLISFDINACYGKSHHGYPELAEIVLMRSSESNLCPN